MRSLSEDQAKAVRAASIVQALAHPARLRLLAALCEREATAAELGARLALRPSAVTRLLRPLLDLRLVAASRDGGVACYVVAEPALHGLVACMEDCAR